MRTLAWIAKEKGISDIYLTSDLEQVSGGSIGFTIEACWYGYTTDYIYSGSSSPETGWLPSYPLGAGLQQKLVFDKIAIKTLAQELDSAKQLGADVPMRYKGGDLPTKVAVESSTWFLEMLMSQGAPLIAGQAPA